MSSLKFKFGLLVLIANNHFSCSAALAHIILREKLHTFGILGCILCVVGSTTIVLHAPPERQIESVTEVWDLATEPGCIFLVILFLALNIFFCSKLLNCKERK